MPGYPGEAMPGAAGAGEEIPPASFQDRGRDQDSAPETYRPGQQP
jgi:hypothetical protein